MTYPNSNNFCGGNFQDWLEVNLIDTCNGSCSWCVEKEGYHPKHHAEWYEIAEEALKTKRTNIILLGGEPLLYKDISKIIRILSAADRKVWITTNGALLSRDFILDNLQGITGINISVHSYDMYQNKKITGVMINDLTDIIKTLHDISVSVRLNCNCISGHIDSAEEIDKYIDFVKIVGADKIRFAELKFDEENFIDLAKTLNYQYGLNDDPFISGCNCNTVIKDIPVNFRQMCGLQTSKRPKPVDPVQLGKQVLYYDGIVYPGWQMQKNYLTDSELLDLFQKVADKKINVEEALEQL
jgi:MoaA/NifB/PqqE/SkfB family radical SAM enzyme